MHLDFLQTPVSWLLLRWHDLFTAIGMPAGNGWTWTASIVCLVVTARLLLLPLFLRQVRHQRALQRLQPRMQELREAHRDDKVALSREMTALHRSEGVKPLAGCLPVVAQIPLFIGLFHVLRHLSDSSAARAHVFGAPLGASFRDSAHVVAGLGGDLAPTRILIVAVLVVSAAATLTTQLVVRANAVTPPAGTAATVQKLVLYLVPLGTLASGLVARFPLGVLVYWLTSNLWTLGQQAVVARVHPPIDGRGVRTGATGPLPAVREVPARAHSVPQVGRRPVRPGRPRQKRRNTVRAR